MDRTVEYLLKKYETKDVNEIWTTEHELEYKQNQRTKQKFQLLDGILNERKSKGPFTFSQGEKGRAKYLIKNHHFKTPLKDEQIIAMIVVYVKLEFHKYNSVNRYNAILSDYDIDKDYFIRFIINMLSQL